MKQRVRFEVAGDTLVGDLYLPAAPGPHPAVVVAGPMTSVKEQVTGVYARALAERALGAVAGYYRDVGELRERDPAGFQAKVDQGIAARRRYEATGEVLTIPAVALTGDAAMTLAETYDYYGTPRAGVPNYVNALAVMSREHFLPFDVQPAAPRLAVPVAMVHSEKALSPAWARRFHEQLRAPKRIEWLTSEGQVDFYDHAPLVSRACDFVAGHLRTWLAGEGAASGP